MSETFGLMIAGDSEAVSISTVVSPYDGSQVGEVAVCGAEHISAALTLAYATARDRQSWLTVEQRIAILERTAGLMSERKEILARRAASEGGKPWIDSVVEVNRAISGVKMCAEHIAQHKGESVPLSEPVPGNLRVAFTQKEPIGVVVAVSAFNHPLNLIVHQVGAAVAAGCPVIVKPAGDTPLSCLGFVSLLREAGLPDAWCQVAIPETTQLATQMVIDERVAFFSFIGSARVGWMLRSKLAPGTRCALEHGGVAPVIVDESADLEKVVPALLKGGFYHAGQVCVSVQRVYVHNSLVDRLAERLVAGATALTVGDPLDATVEVGPIIRAEELERIHAWITHAVDAGAIKLCGGNIMENNCYEPTILLNPPVDAEVSNEEIFGPVICLYTFEDVDVAIEAANSLDVSFQAAVFCQDIDRAMQLYSRIDGSAVMLNDHTAFRQDNMPFAGLKHSGLGIGGIAHTIEDMQIDKMLVIKSVK